MLLGLVYGKRGANLELIAPTHEKELARWMDMPVGKHMDEPSQPSRREIFEREERRRRQFKNGQVPQASTGCATGGKRADWLAPDFGIVCRECD
jgi:hypothetical protein